MQYLGKVLELRSVERVQDTYFAIVCLHAEKEKVEFKWKLDSVTGNNLTEIIQMSPHHKYRLSLQCYTNKQDLGYFSSLSKITGETSEKIYFACTEHFAKNINWINNINSIKEFTRIHSANKQEKKKKKNRSIPKLNFNGRSKLVAAITVLLLFGFTSFSFFNSSKAIELPLSDYKESVNEVLVKENTDLKFKEMENASNTVFETEEGIKEPKEDVKQQQQVAVQPVNPSTPFIEVPAGKVSDLPEGYVALTFDDGPSQYTKQIVDILAQYQVGGTFFFVGQKVGSYPDNVKYAFNHGFSVANHSLTHSDFTNLSSNRQIYEWNTTNERIKSITNQPVNLFRPPYGAINGNIVNLFNQQQVKTIMWNKDPRDWEKRNTNAIINYTLGTNGTGSIYVFHEIEATVGALPAIIEHFQSQGLKIVSLR